MGVTSPEDVIAAVKSSEVLEVNSTGSGIRRKGSLTLSPLPKNCVVLAVGIPTRQPGLFYPNADEEAMDGSSTEVARFVNDEAEEERDKYPLADGEVEGVDCPQMVPVKHSYAMEWLKDQLQSYGTIKYVNLPRFLTTGSIRGFAFVEFASKEAAEKAVSALAPTEKDLVSTHSDPNCDDDKKVGAGQPRVSKKEAALRNKAASSAEAGWMPKTAPLATNLSLEDRLARQLVWRCCSRRSKQALAAYRRLCAAGYRRPNPIDVEYRLITEGAPDSTEVNEPALRLLPYEAWSTWHERFYTWLQAWIARMHTKTAQLTARAERRRHVPTTPPLKLLPTPPKPDAIDTTAAVPPKLPENYCPGCVVEVNWPLDEELVSLPEPRQQMRRVRTAIERELLLPLGLLHAVAHFDTQSPDLELVESRGVGERTGFARVFVRFKGRGEAEAFAEALQCPGGILDEERERRYCEAIAVAKAGAVERRRRAQAAKRKRKGDSKKEAPETPNGKQSAAAMVESAPVAPRIGVGVGDAKPKRIVFNE